MGCGPYKYAVDYVPQFHGPLKLKFKKSVHSSDSSRLLAINSLISIKSLGPTKQTFTKQVHRWLTHRAGSL